MKIKIEKSWGRGPSIILYFELIVQDEKFIHVQIYVGKSDEANEVLLWIFMQGLGGAHMSRIMI